MAVRYPVLSQPRAEHFAGNRVPKPAHFRGDTTVQPVTYTAGELLHRAGQEHSRKTAAVFCEENVSWTYQRLDEEVTRLAANLYDVGLRPNHRVGVFMSNYSPVFLLQLAAARLGAVVVMFHPTFLTHELEHALQLTQCKVLVVQPSHKTTDCIQMLLQLLPELEISDSCAIESARFPSLTSVFVADCRGVGAAGYHSLCPTDWRSIPGLTCFNTFMAGPINPATVQVLESLLVKPTDPLCILFTSGSTGCPKAVTMTHHSVLNSAYFNGQTAGMTSHDIICLPMPLTHCTGLVGGLFTTLTAGGTLVFPGSVYTSEATLRAIQMYQCNITFGVGSMYIDQICHPKFGQFDLSSLQCGIIGGSNCPSSVKENIMQRLHLVRLLTAYGMSETSCAGTLTPCNATRDQMMCSTGQCLPHMEAKVLDVQTGQVVGVGQRGELCVRGIYLMQGYWGNPAQTHQAIDKDGWLRTGDIAEFDSQGFCRIVDRKKDMIIKGGVNIFPGEIEQCLVEHPDVQSAAVVGVPHELMEEQVCACIIVKDKTKPLTTGALRRYCKGRISPFKIPNHIVTLNAFPKTSTGKVLKPRLVQLASLHLKSTQRLIAKSVKFRPY